MKGETQPRVENKGRDLVISYQWRKSGRLVPGLMMLLVAGGILWAMAGLYVCLLPGGGACYETRRDLYVIAGVTVFMALMMYLGIGFLLNSTEINVSKDAVSFRIHGLPWIGGRTTIPAAKIKRVYVSEDWTADDAGTRYCRYSVFIETAGFNRRVFGEFLDDKESADELAQRVRSALGTKE
jgi:hypothetical protein